MKWTTSVLSHADGFCLNWTFCIYGIQLLLMHWCMPYLRPQMFIDWLYLILLIWFRVKETMPILWMSKRCLIPLLGYWRCSDCNWWKRFIAYCWLRNYSGWPVSSTFTKLWNHLMWAIRKGHRKTFPGSDHLKSTSKKWILFLLDHQIPIYICFLLYPS
jgi:hypothetical protein